MNSSANRFGGQFSVNGVPLDEAASGDPESTPNDGRVRLQKALANAGVASRRACESLIVSGRVQVNGRVQRELGSRIDAEHDEVRVDGVIVQLDTTRRYFVLNKPRGVVSTMHDEHGRPDLREFAAQCEDRLYNVGRLDTDTSGLLILTNDGELAHQLAHPSFGVEKTYVARVRGRVAPATLQQLRDGIELADGPIFADRARLLPGGSNRTHSLVELTLHSGRNRIVRRMLAAVGHPVEELVRRQFGPLHLGTLRIGELRELSAAERGALLSAVRDERTASGEQSVTADRSVTAGRPGDGKGARGMRGVAARGNPNARRTQNVRGGAANTRGGAAANVRGTGTNARRTQNGDTRG